MKVSIRDRLEAVGASAWDGLVAASRLRSPFLSWAWQSEWVRTFAADRRLEIRCVEDGAGNLIAILPLYESAPGSLQLIGGADVSDYLDLISLEGREEEAWMALLQSRTAERVEWHLHAVPETSPTVAGLAPLAAACGLAVSATVEERCPVLALPPSWDTYLAHLSGKHRHELQRKMRRLDRDAPDAHASCVQAPADIAARLGEFLALHRSSRVGKARFMDERMERFFRSALAAFAERGAARLWFLDGASGPIAGFVTIEWDGTVGLYNSGFTPERAALSPGVVLLAQLIRDAIARGRQRFDFLRGEERYKYEFEPVAEAVFYVRVQ
ncbi:MAG TPA: GNAT family N-acetyltransferase [Methylomirabilota bacterium]|nr:GNAT family N-acetyltransferase [Methylomirabilota bacterium]